MAKLLSVYFFCLLLYCRLGSVIVTAVQHEFVIFNVDTVGISVSSTSTESTKISPSEVSSTATTADFSTSSDPSTTVNTNVPTFTDAATKVSTSTRSEVSTTVPTTEVQTSNDPSSTAITDEPISSDASTTIAADLPTSSETLPASTTSTTRKVTTTVTTTIETTTVVQSTPQYVTQQRSFTWDSSDTSANDVVFRVDEGYFISVTVSNVNMANGNYLLIEGGESHTEDATDGRAFANKVAGPLQYLFKTTSVYGYYYVNDNDMTNNTFTILFEGIEGPTTTAPPSTTSPISLPTTEKGDSIYVTVNVSGKPLHEYSNQKTVDDFRGCVVIMATNYCKHEKILLTHEMTKDYVILANNGINPCPYNWPHSESCVTITFKLPVFPEESIRLGYQLTAEHLETMWLRSDQFDDHCLYNKGYSVYQEPDIDRSIMWWAISVSLVIAAFAVLLGFLRSFSSKVRSAMKKRGGTDSETMSIISDKKDSISSLTPHYLQDHMDTPKLFEP